MRIRYDRQADALYIRLLDGEFECRAVRLTPDVALDFAGDERLVGIEVLGASRLFDTPNAPVVDLINLAGRSGPAA